MFPNPKFEQDLGCYVTKAIAKEESGMELSTWAGSMLSDAETERLTHGRFKRWDDFEKAVTNTRRALGTWGVKGKMSNFTFIIAGFKVDKIYLLHMNPLTNEDIKKIQDNLDFDIEKINQHITRLVWFTKV